MGNNNSVKAFKAGLWYTISNFLAKGLAFVTMPVFTRVLSKTEFGQYTNFATWQNLLLILVTFELYSTVARARYDFEKEIDQYISTITLTGSMFTMLCYIIVICFMPFFSRLLSLEPIYIHIMFSYMLTAPALQILQAKYRIFLKYKLAAILTIMSSIGSVLVAVAMVFIAEDKLFGRIFGQEIVLIVVNTGIYISILLKGRHYGFKYCRYALAIALPLIPHLLAGTLLGTFDKIAIEKICGAEDLAFYSLAFNCSLLARVLWESLNQAMVPWLYDNLNQDKIEKIQKVSIYYLIFFLIVAVGITLLAPEVIFIFGGTAYTEAKYVMPPIIMGSCFQFAYAMYVNLEMYEKKTLSISIGTIAAAALNIPLNYFFIGTFGYIAAAYTTMLCYGILCLFHYLIVKKIGMSHVYHNKENVLVLSAMCAFTFGAEFVYQFEWLRRILLLAYFIIAIIVILKKRKLLLKYVKVIKNSKK